MQTLLYALLVHIAAVGFAGLCVLVGSAVLGRRRPSGVVDGVADLATRLALGIIVGFTIVVLLGLAHVLSPWAAWPCFAILALVGGLRICTERLGLLLLQLRRGAEAWKDEWAAKSKAFRMVAGLLAVALTGLLLNIYIGALCPDVQRDSLWYHLTMPGQWLIRGDVAMLPHVMPSTYPLGIEALYTFLIPLGDTLFITAFMAQVHVITLAMFLALGWRYGGMAGLVVMGTLVPFAYASSFAIAPIPAKPDPITTFLVGIGWWRLARLLDEPDQISPRELFIAGVICGGATVAKLSSLLVLLPLALCFVAALALRQRRFEVVVAAIVWPSVGVLLVMMPWLIRAGMYSGNPFIHVAREILPVAEEFIPALRGYDRVPMFHPLTSEGLTVAITESFPLRLLIAATSLNTLFFIIPIASVVSLMSRKPSVRATSLGFLIAYAVWVPLLYGKGEEIRYFSVGVLAAGPALAGFCAEISRRVSPRALPWLAGCLLLGTGYTYLQHQINFASLHTVNWRFRPVVLTEDRLKWLEPTPDGLKSHYYRLLDEELPREAHVLLLDSKGPFYLNRRAEWCDYFTCPMLDDWWPGYDSFEAHADLTARGITHILGENRGTDLRVMAMESEGLIVTIPIDGVPDDWALWLVTSP